MSSTSASTQSPGQSVPKSDWLPNLIFLANLLKDGAEALPVPCVKGSLGMVAAVLEIAQKVKKNRDDWKEVCASAVGIVELVKKEIECHGVVMSERLKAFGEELVSLLEGIQQKLSKLKENQFRMRRRLMEVVQADKIGVEILGYKDRIKELRDNFVMITVMENNANLSVGFAKVQENFSALMLHRPETIPLVSAERVEFMAPSSPVPDVSVVRPHIFTLRASAPDFVPHGFASLAETPASTPHSFTLRADAPKTIPLVSAERIEFTAPSSPVPDVSVVRPHIFTLRASAPDFVPQGFASLAEAPASIPRSFTLRASAPDFVPREFVSPAGTPASIPRSFTLQADAPIFLPRRPPLRVLRADAPDFVPCNLRAGHALSDVQSSLPNDDVFPPHLRSLSRPNSDTIINVNGVSVDGASPPHVPSSPDRDTLEYFLQHYPDRLIVQSLLHIIDHGANIAFTRGRLVPQMIRQQICSSHDIL
ncbi:hypothetical protein B0H14DRAFT_3425781 [Mycena olivaceomarginata]|nr:hypothetical protein B0H14DRAFT_3425781 [Mycena olivaceomarginata]